MLVASERSGRRMRESPHLAGVRESVWVGVSAAAAHLDWRGIYGFEGAEIW